MNLLYNYSFIHVISNHYVDKDLVKKKEEVYSILHTQSFILVNKTFEVDITFLYHEKFVDINSYNSIS